MGQLDFRDGLSAAENPYRLMALAEDLEERTPPKDDDICRLPSRVGWELDARPTLPTDEAFCDGCQFFLRLVQGSDPRFRAPSGVARALLITSQCSQCMEPTTN
jgi:hypothetical protein